MAGDWIKMRSDLFTHPKVVRISSALKADTLRTVGGLMSVWCLFDAHSEDGCLEGYTPEVLDDHLRWPGFSACMQAVGWLIYDPENGLSLPEFDTHNGQSAKRRAMETERKREARKLSASNADETRTREEKRREEKKEVTSSDNSVGAASAAPPKPDAKGSRLPADWQLPKAWGDWALAEFPHWTPDVVRIEAHKFADHWRAATGKDGRKADWPATWRNWCRNDICQRAHPLQGAARPSKRAQMTDDERAVWSAAEGEKARRLLFGDAPAADLIDITPEGIPHEAV